MRELIRLKHLRMFRDDMVSAAHNVIDSDTARQPWIHQRQGNRIDGGDKGFGDILVGVAAAAVAGHLGDFKDRHMRLGMLAAVTHQLGGDLLGGSHADIGEDAAPEFAREVVVEDDARIVGTVGKTAG